MLASTALRRATNLQRDPNPHSIKTITSPTKAMKIPKKLVPPPLLEGLLVPVDAGLGDEVVGGVLAEDIVQHPDELFKFLST